MTPLREASDFSAAHRGAWRGLLTVQATLVRQLNQELKAAGHVPIEWYDVLVHLSEAPDERLRLSVLADAILLSRSGLTRLMDRMDAAGLLRREVCPEDRRGAFAILTDAGRVALESAAPAHIAGIRRHFACHLSETDAATLCRVFARVLAAL